MRRCTVRAALALSVCLMTGACDKAPARGEAPGVHPGRPNPPELGAGEEATAMSVDAAASSDVGDEATPDDAAATSPVSSCSDGSYFPIAVGNVWRYQIRGRLGEVKRDKWNRVVSEEPIPVEGPHHGKLAFRLESSLGAERALKAVSWQNIVDGRLVRYAEMSYGPDSGVHTQTSQWEPYRTRFDTAFPASALGQRWTEKYVDQKVWFSPARPPEVQTTLHEDIWIVVAVDEEVVVPAGTFKALRVRKLLNSTSDERGKTYWFARCVGKVKEVGVASGGHDESLLEYSVHP